MIGIILAGLYLLYQFIFGTVDFAVAFVSAMVFLLYWYIVTGIIRVAIISLISLGIAGGGAIAGGAEGGKLGALLGFAAGGAIGGWFLLRVAIIRAALVGIAYVLSVYAVTVPAEGAAIWNWPVLAILFTLLIIMLRVGKK